MKRSIVVALLILGSFAQAQKMIPVKVGEDGDIQLKIPDDFINMNDQDRMQRVASSKVPLAMFTNEAQEVTLGVNYNAMQWNQNDIQLIYDFYKASFQNLFDEIDFIQEDIRSINGRDFIVFEFVGTIIEDNAFSDKKPQKNYTYIQYTSWNDQVLLFNFSCKARLKNEWEGVAKEIMESVKIK